MLKVYAAPTIGEDRHAASRKLLQWAYESCTRREMPVIDRGENGKPFFRDDLLHFSLSYTADYCFCAVCDSRIGLDAESCRDVKHALIEGVLSKAEQSVLAQCDDLQETFMQLWTLKESFCKFTGEGIARTKLRETEFTLSGTKPLLLGREDLVFSSKKVDMDGTAVVISFCTDKEQTAELYIGDEKYAEF